MKRHRSLIPLSHDHHDGLVIAQGLILGRSKAPRSTWPTDRRLQVDRVLEFFREGLRRHFQAEEDHVFPLVAVQLRGGAELVKQLRQEHDEMRDQIHALEQNPELRLDERLREFGECLKQHIRKEEHVLFERMQDELEPGALNAMGEGLRSVYSSSGEASCRT